MKKAILYLTITVSTLVWACKKDKDQIGPVETVQKDQFLKSVKVAGAREVALDTAGRIIQIILPETYKSDIVDIELSLVDDAKLELNSSDPGYSPGHVKCGFRGLPPQNFSLFKQTSQGHHTRSYRVYVRHEGPLAAQMVGDIALSPSGPTTARGGGVIQLVAGIGTIPETPDDERKITPFIKNDAKNVHVRGLYDMGSISFENILPLLEADRTIVGLQYGDKIFEFPEAKKLVRGPMSVHFGAAEHFFKAFKKGQTVTFNGGMFLNSHQYAIKLENSRLAAAIDLPVKQISLNGLETQFPSTIPDDHYLISFFEDSRLIQKSPLVIARDTTIKAIGQIWVEISEDRSIPVRLNANAIIVQRGQQLIANPFPVVLDNLRTPFDPSRKMPDLALKMNGQVTLLKATVKEDPSYADGSARMYMGAYRIPADLPAGKYEAAMVLGGNKYSLPYWSAIEVR